MKIISTLIVMLFMTPLHAKIYKCMAKGNTTYQQTECKQAGAEFTPLKDISIKQQKSAVKELTTDIEVITEKKKIQKEADDKERQLRTEEDKANAIYENARANKMQAEEMARQTNVLQDNNRLLRNQPGLYPYSPVIKPRPVKPIVNPLPTRATPVLPASRPPAAPTRPAPTPLSERAQPLPINR